MKEFGASFRKARESRNVSINEIAEETRISSRFLTAIENEQFELLPGGHFNRAFIRTYAEQLGLDPNETVAAYEKIFHPVEEEPAQQEPERGRGPTTKIPVYYVAVAGLLILVVVFYFATRHQEPSVVTESAPATEAAPPKPAAAPAAEPASPLPVDSAALPVTAATIATSPAATVTAATAATAAPQTQSASNANAPIVVDLEVREESWFKLSSDGNAIVTGEILQPGMTRRYTANSSMDVSFGNAGGVTLRLNGQPVSSLGKSGQVRNITITPQTPASSLAVASR
jgi:cytoskeletal protein RodZ